ncbi:MAG: cytochrome ubiquinol oxidase subunit I [bacterium]|nr:cytochrome ubiquinol oxidase subunit I [bacterium]
MTDLLSARLLISFSLIFHILFAVVGIGLPLLMVIAEARWLKTGEEVWLSLAKHWAKGATVLFAIGAVTGTLLSFELGLLWPRFMEFSGGIIGLPFALEGFAFFTEAIFLGIYLYGWKRISPRAHWVAGVAVSISGAASAFLVVLANAWMNAPTGFDLVNGKPVNIDPIAAMLNPASFSQTLHMILAAYVATGFAVAGLHAFLLLRQPRNLFHHKALSVALMMGGVALCLQMVSGDISARDVARRQPIKLAAMEGQFETEKGAPLRIGGWPDVEKEETRHALEIPKLLSFLSFHDINAEVIGLKSVPREDRPPVVWVHLAFQTMVASAMVLFLVTLWSWFRLYRRKGWADSRKFLMAVALTGPLGFLALEAGWIVTEVGRQPWIIYKVMRTSEAVSPLTGLHIPLIVFSMIFLFLGGLTLWLLKRIITASPFWPMEGEDHVRS